MIKTPHWQLKSYLNYIRTDGDKQAYEARFPVLMHLIMSTNANLRCFVGIDALCRDTGYTNKPITEALQWLQDRGAIYNVPKEKRVGVEKRLHANKKVWQLTGILQVKEDVIDYLYTGEAGSETKNLFEKLLIEIKQNAPAEIKLLFDQKIGVHNPTKITETEQNPLKIPVQNTYKPDSLEHETGNLSVQHPTKDNTADIPVHNPTKNEEILGQNTHEIDVQNLPEGINNSEAINKDKDINDISRSKRDDSLVRVLDDIFNPPEDPDPDPETDEPTDVWDKPYTPEEYEYFKDSVSLEALETDVYNPCHNTSQARSDFRKPQKTLSGWHQLVAVVEHFFPPETTGYAAKIAQQFAGTAKSGQRKDFGISPPMSPVEACAFAYWLREGEALEHLPERAERIQERVMQFRALPDHFAHVNFARYVLDDLLASKEPSDEPQPDPDLFKPAPREVLDKAYAEAEALLGFSLSGDY